MTGSDGSKSTSMYSTSSTSSLCSRVSGSALCSIIIDLARARRLLLVLLSLPCRRSRMPAMCSVLRLSTSAILSSSKPCFDERLETTCARSIMLKPVCNESRR